MPDVEAVGRRPGPAFTTVLAALLTIVLSIIYLLAGGALIVIAVVGRGQREVREAIAELGPFGNVLDAFVIVVVLLGFAIFVVSVWSLFLGVKVFRRRSWARWLLFLTFLLFFALSLLALYGALSGETETSPTTPDLLPLIIQTLIVGFVLTLLVLPSTSADFRKARDHERAVVHARAEPPPATTPPPTTTTPPESSEQ
jgi:hypothetical protein